MLEWRAKGAAPSINCFDGSGRKSHSARLDSKAVKPRAQHHFTTFPNRSRSFLLKMATKNGKKRFRHQKQAMTLERKNWSITNMSSWMVEWKSQGHTTGTSNWKSLNFKCWLGWRRKLGNGASERDEKSEMRDDEKHPKFRRKQDYYKNIPFPRIIGISTVFHGEDGRKKRLSFNPSAVLYDDLHTWASWPGMGSAEGGERGTNEIMDLFIFPINYTSAI